MSEINYGRNVIDMGLGMKSQAFTLLNTLSVDYEHNMAEQLQDLIYEKPRLANAFTCYTVPYHNGREKGFYFRITVSPTLLKELGKEQQKCMNMVWFEHRIGDHMVCIQWEDTDDGEGKKYLNYLDGEQTFADLPEGINPKVDFSKNFKYKDFSAMMKYFWYQIENYMKKIAWDVYEFEMEEIGQ